MTKPNRKPLSVHGLPHLQRAYDVAQRPANSAGGLHGRALIAEDSIDQQVVIRFLLRKWKLEFDLADDGQAAYELAEQSKVNGRPYDLILMDIQMPRLDGLDATRRLRQQGWRGPIVAFTACYLTAGDREKCLQAGCDDYLVKPIFADRLREVLGQYLGCVPQVA